MPNIININEILTTIVATIISGSVKNLFESLSSNIIMPFLYIDLNNDGIHDRENLKKYTIAIGNKNIKVGKFLLSCIEFIILLVIIWLINKIFKSY